MLGAQEPALTIQGLETRLLIVVPHEVHIACPGPKPWNVAIPDAHAQRALALILGDKQSGGPWLLV